MRISRRAKRMNRHHQGSKGEEGLILTSVIDIFTILVFFLLVHMGDESAVQNTQSIQLPASNSDQKPASALVVTVSKDDVIVQGRSVLTRAQAEVASVDILPALLDELRLQRDNQVLGAELDASKHPAIIMADKDIPYRLLRKIMMTLSEANYTDISLAVVQRE